MCRFRLDWTVGLMMLALPLASTAASPRGDPPARAVSVESCGECHDGQAASHARGPHRAASCADCHSGVAEHLEDPAALPGRPPAKTCLTCHQSGARHMNWAFSEHSRAAVECRDCHGLHEPKVGPGSTGGVLLEDPSSALCLTCHQEVAPRLNMTSHHPVKEGALSCASCHDPHGSRRTTLASRTEICTSCHQALRGPHTFEHPSAAEGCATCHHPHGSPNRRLLQIAQPMLCLQCHSIADNRHGQTGAAGARITGAALRSCTSCHSAVHGSSFDEHLRY